MAASAGPRLINDILSDPMWLPKFKTACPCYLDYCPLNIDSILMCLSVLLNDLNSGIADWHVSILKTIFLCNAYHLDIVGFVCKRMIAIMPKIGQRAVADKENFDDFIRGLIVFAQTYPVKWTDTLRNDTLSAIFATKDLWPNLSRLDMAILGSVSKSIGNDKAMEPVKHMRPQSKESDTRVYVPATARSAASPTSGVKPEKYDPPMEYNLPAGYSPSSEGKRSPCMEDFERELSPLKEAVDKNKQDYAKLIATTREFMERQKEAIERQNTALKEAMERQKEAMERQNTAMKEAIERQGTSMKETLAAIVAMKEKMEALMASASRRNATHEEENKRQFASHRSSVDTRLSSIANKLDGSVRDITTHYEERFRSIEAKIKEIDYRTAVYEDYSCWDPETPLSAYNGKYRESPTSAVAATRSAAQVEVMAPVAAPVTPVITPPAVSPVAARVSPPVPVSMSPSTARVSPPVPVSMSPSTARLSSPVIAPVAAPLFPSKPRQTTHRVIVLAKDLTDSDHVRARLEEISAPYHGGVISLTRDRDLNTFTIPFLTAKEQRSVFEILNARYELGFSLINVKAPLAIEDPTN
jgi:hypothetical protein